MTEVARRFVITAGTARYRDEEIEQLPHVPGDLDQVTEVFASMQYGSALRLLDLDRNELLERLIRWKRAESRSGDALVVYYSGHGERSDDGHHYLLCHDSEFGDPDLALETEDLVTLFGRSGVRHLLVVIDTCYAGLGATQGVKALTRDLTLRLAAGGPEALDGFAVIAAARPREQAEDGLFAQALTAAVADPGLGGPRQARLALEEVVRRVNSELLARGALQRAEYYMSGDGTFAFMPNPRHVPDLPPEVDLAEQRAWASQTVRRESEWAQRVLELERLLANELSELSAAGARVPELESPASVLVERPSPANRYRFESPRRHDYFTGRTAALTVLGEWLARRGRLSHPEYGVLVTGSPGVGKSALLSRLARDGAITVSFQARNLTLADLVDLLGDHLVLPAPRTLQDVLSAIAVSGEPLDLVIDGLDEAVPSEVRPLLFSLLRPLAAMPSVRLLVGTRPHLVDLAGPEFWVLDLDDPRWSTQEDLAAYAGLLLTAPDGPGSHGRPLNPSLAAQVATQAEGNYLAVRLMARTLAHRPPSAPPVELPSGGLGAVISWALREQLGPDERTARAMLTPIAFAQGRGLPWGTVWPALASSVLGRSVRGEEIAELVAAAGSYLTEALDPLGRSVYRLYHEAFADELRAAASQDAQAQLSRALVALVPPALDGSGPDWMAADPYIRAHLATHAAAAGLLDELATDPLFLLAADHAALLPALDSVRSPSALAARRVYQASAAMLLGTHELSERAALLELAAVQHDARSLAAAVRARVPSRRWGTRWALPSRPHRTIGWSPHSVTGAAERVLDGQTVIVTAGLVQGVQVWDFASGVAVRAPIPGWFVRLTVPHDSDGPLVMTLGEGQAQGWDLDTGRPLGPALRTGAVEIAMSAGPDGPIGVLLEPDRIEVVDLAVGRAICTIDPTFPSRRAPHLRRVAVACQGSELTVAIAAVGWGRNHTQHAELEVWSVDLVTGRTRRTDRLSHREHEIQELRVHNGTVHVVLSHLASNRGGTVVSQRGRIRTMRVHARVRGAAMAFRDDGPHYWYNRNDCRLRSVDAAGHPRVLVDVDQSAYRQVLPLESTTRPAVVTVDDLATFIQVWEPTAVVEDRYRQRSPVSDPEAVPFALTRIDGRQHVLLGTRTGLRLLDPATGAQGTGLSVRLIGGRLATHPELPPVLVGPPMPRGRRKLVRYNAATDEAVTLTGDLGRFALGAELIPWNGQEFLVCCFLNRFELWDSRPKLVCRVFDGDGHFSVSASFSILAKRELGILLAAGGSVIQYDGTRTPTIHSHPAARVSELSLLTWWRGSPVLCFAEPEGPLVVLDALKGDELHRWSNPSLSTRHLAAIEVDDRLVMVTADTDRRLRVFDSASSDCRLTVHIGSWITGLLISDEHHVLVRTRSGVMSLRLL
ncbi:caspase family protein [Kitasatospora sp. NPDC057542]|uniref:caspase family protein n=1 Tax=Kitasatospora sp. NPDC057542 TaxID=3346162 RepID=UPI0036C1D4F7